MKFVVVSWYAVKWESYELEMIIIRQIDKGCRVPERCRIDTRMRKVE